MTTMQDLHVYEYGPQYHSDLLRRSEYARLAQALRDEKTTGTRIYQLAGQRLLKWGEALQRVAGDRDPVTVSDSRVRTSELPAV